MVYNVRSKEFSVVKNSRVLNAYSQFKPLMSCLGTFKLVYSQRYLRASFLVEKDSKVEIYLFRRGQPTSGL